MTYHTLYCDYHVEILSTFCSHPTVVINLTSLLQQCFFTQPMENQVKMFM